MTHTKNNSFWIFLSAFFLLFLTLAQFGFAPEGNDLEEHRHMALEKTYTPPYAPLFRAVFSIFATQNTMWNLLIVFLICIPGPILIYKITGEPLSAFFYFAISSVAYSFMAGYAAELLMLLFLLGLLATKNNYARFGLVLIGSLSHSLAPILLPGTLFLIILNDNQEFFKEKFHGIALSIAGCSPFWGKNTPKEIDFELTSNSYGGHNLTLNNFASFFIKVCPFPFLVVALNEFWRRKRFDLLALLIGGFFIGFIYGTRAWLLAALIMVIGFSWAWKKFSHKRVWGALVVLWFLFEFEQWIALVWWCS